MGRIRLHVALDYSAFSLETFILDNIEPGSTVVTDSWRSYNFIEDAKCTHEKLNLTESRNKENLYGVHLVISLVKRLIRGTFQGRFDPKYLQNYLDEFVFRFNRRKSKSIGKKFMRIVQQAVKSVGYPSTKNTKCFRLEQAHIATHAKNRTPAAASGWSAAMDTSKAGQSSTSLWH